MHLFAASSASLYVTQAGHVSVVDGVGGRPCSCLILHRIPWQGLFVFCVVDSEDCCWCLFRFLLLDRFFFGFFGVGARLSLFSRIVFVMTLCSFIGCWCIAVNSCCHACSNARVMVFGVVGMCHLLGMWLFSCSVSLAWCLWVGNM